MTSDKDYATLLTCMSYGVNVYSLLVRGYCAPYHNPKKDCHVFSLSHL
ncbi:hypothetical protein AB6M97_07125 [Streptococcus hillyeri]|nr:hypothetical protein [Streptococcus hillyeri]